MPSALLHTRIVVSPDPDRSSPVGGWGMGWEDGEWDRRMGDGMGGCSRDVLVLAKNMGSASSPVASIPPRYNYPTGSDDPVLNNTDSCR